MAQAIDLTQTKRLDSLGYSQAQKTALETNSLPLRQAIFDLNTLKQDQSGVQGGFGLSVVSPALYADASFIQHAGNIDTSIKCAVLITNANSASDSMAAYNALTPTYPVQKLYEYANRSYYGAIVNVV